MALQAFFSFVFLVLLLLAVGYGSAYTVQRTELLSLRAQKNALAGVGLVMREFMSEIRAIWSGQPVAPTEKAQYQKLAADVSAALPGLYKALERRTSGAALAHYQFTQEDFKFAGYADLPSQLDAALAELGDDDLSALWKRRRIGDLMGLIKVAHHRHTKLMVEALTKPLKAAEIENSLLKVLRSRASNDDITAEILRQIEERSSATGKGVDDLTRVRQLVKGVVDILCFMRDHNGRLITLGVLVQTFSGRGMERLFKEGVSDSDRSTPEGRLACKTLGAYIEGLPSWDGRYPLHDVALASHAAFASPVLQVLLRVQ